MSDVPYVGFGNDTIARQPRVSAGDPILCPCGSIHTIEAAKDERGNPTDLLMFMRCGESLLLAAVKGRLTVGVPADCSGAVDIGHTPRGSEGSP